ncbi:isopeptide-forming domain-containing fimbrial protein [Luteimonas sp. SX5]|uniref:Isopeptide-forming domain-containing fimbrial protein n=1 Tax=Luteimonas galliterrae TaxID=2940486 RepID=A0ABT0MI18_9GAMM|nr:isopeptide-forming domain-containing fimbrial protein [Luteimonas galliterrae]MCL1634506.1 isopeptide-forming domain-containing fimbrial protein [Luteimonas galliterrae]
MSGHAMQNTISETVSRRRRWRTLVACLLLAALWAAAAPVFAQARSFARRFPAPMAQPVTVRGNIALIGNTSLSCPGTCTAQNGAGRNNGTNMTAVDVDTDGTTTNSSTATLNLPAGSTVLFAGLYWAGQTSTAAARNSVLLRTPASAGYATVSATNTDVISNAYQSFIDVTTTVAASGNGAYTVANVGLTPGDGQWAGWTLVVAYQNASGDLRNLSVFDGFQLADGVNSTIDVEVSGFITPRAPNPVNSDIGLVTYDGDRGQNDAGSSTASLQFGPNDTSLTPVSNAVNTVFDVFNSTISVDGTNVTAGRVPSYTNTLGIDIDVFRPNTPLPNESSSLVARIRGSSGDVNYPGIMTIATDVFEPEVVTNFSKSATDANGAPFRPGDEVTYSVNVANTGNDDAEIVVVTDPLPAGVTFVPGSIVVTNGPNAGPKTDAAGDDQVEFNGSQIVFRAGVGANSADGGVLEPSPTPTPTSATTIEFKVTINPDVANGTSIANVASIGYRSKSTGIPRTGNTPPASFTVVNEANLQITKTNTPANGPADGSADTVAAGSSVDYSIVVTNLGPSAANGAVVRDPAPTGLTCATAVCGSATNGAVCPSATGAALVSELQSAAGTVIPTMPLNGAVTFTLTCTVAP